MVQLPLYERGKYVQGYISPSMHCGGYNVLVIDVQATFCETVFTLAEAAEESGGFCVQFMRSSGAQMKDTPEVVLLCEERKKQQQRGSTEGGRERCYFPHLLCPFCLIH